MAVIGGLSAAFTLGKTLQHGSLRIGFGQHRRLHVSSEASTSTVKTGSTGVTNGAVASTSSTGPARTGPSGLKLGSASPQERAQILEGSRSKIDIPKVIAKQAGSEELITVSDYLYEAKEMNKSDGGPPRWFCSLRAKPPEGSQLPVLLFLSGIDGTGLGLLRQEKSLSRYFEVRNLHIPTTDRTPFQGLVNLVVSELERAAAENPERPLYIVAESFGGCLAFAAAARLPQLYLHLVVANPATSFEKTELKPVLPLLKIIPKELFGIVPVLFSYTMGDPVRMALAGIDPKLAPLERSRALADSMTAMLPDLPLLAEILPQDTLQWKLELLQDGARQANEVLPKVKARVLLLISEKDRMLPSAEEGDRLVKVLPRVSVRRFKDSGHTLFLEEGIELMSVIKGASFYRQTRAHEDPVLGFFPPTPAEIERATQGPVKFIRDTTSPVFLTTDLDGRVHWGLDALPTEGPLLFVGNHQTFAPDLYVIVSEILEKTGMLVRGLAHPIALGQFSTKEKPREKDPLLAQESPDPMGLGDLMRTFGAVPVTGPNMYALLANKQPVLLFPGGVREALRLKGEDYQLFWPERSEFVRMAVRHEATIVPFGAIGVDDSLQLLLDREELRRIPRVGEWLERSSRVGVRVREEGSIADDTLIAPVFFPKPPSRIYVKFQKPIVTSGLVAQGFLKDKEASSQMYSQVKSEVEGAISYLIEKRSQDPYAEFLPRILYEASWGGERKAPTFKEL